MVNYVSNNYNLSVQVEVAIGNEEPVSETLKWIAHGPSHYVFKYQGCVIMGATTIPRGMMIYKLPKIVESIL